MKRQPQPSTLFPYTTLFRSCDAYERLVQTDIARDSMDAALRDAGAWLKSQPQAPRAWDLWADALERQERLLEALRSEEHTSELQSHVNLVCRLLLEKKKTSKSYRCSY